MNRKISDHKMDFLRKSNNFLTIAEVNEVTLLDFRPRLAQQTHENFCQSTLNINPAILTALVIQHSGAFVAPFNTRIPL
jgi:hypothetical protein